MLPVLMYHGIHADREASGFFDAVYSVRPPDFERQLDWLLEHGYRSIRLRDIGEQPPGRGVVISFDDGDISNSEIALRALERRGMVGEFFITTDFIGRRGSLTEQDVRALAALGMGVQSHGCTHRYLDDLSAPDLEYELRESRRRLERLSGCTVTALALPGGRGGERERVAALAAGYRHLLNSVPGCNPDWRPGLWLQRLPITRDLSLAGFAQVVQWRGLTPRYLRMRHLMLAQAKRLLGNQRYERWRERAVL